MIRLTPPSWGGSRADGRATLWWAASLLLAGALLAAPRAAAEGEPPASTAGAFAQLDSLQRAFQAVVDEVTPSVVGIRAQRRQVNTLPGFAPDEELGTVEQQIVINGSGTVVDGDGLILTNEHVVHRADTIDVMFHDGQKLRATVLASDARSDLAIIQVPRDGLRPVAVGDWDSVDRGQWSIVVGNPFGLGLDGHLSVSVGVISNLGRQLPGLGEVDDRFYNDMVQVTAPIHPGNSGGPLFNIRGELIGVVTAMHTRAPADEGVGFAIPMTPVKWRVVRQLCQGRRIEYGYLGATVRVLEPDERRSLGLTQGVVVQRLEPGGPAARAGLRLDDVVLRYEGQPVGGPAQFAELIGQSPVGTRVTLDLLRNGRPTDMRVATERREVSRVSWMRGDAVSWRGMRLSDLGEDARQRMRAAADVQGIVVIDVEPDSPASRARIRVGDVIEEVGGRRVADTLDFLLRVREVKGTLEVSVRDTGKRLITP